MHKIRESRLAILDLNETQSGSEKQFSLSL